MQFLNLELPILIRLTLNTGTILINLLLLIMAWVMAKKIRLLNRTLKTKYEHRLEFLGWLFLIISIGTLLITVVVWINPFILTIKKLI